MDAKILFPLVLAVAIVTAGAAEDEKFPLLQAGPDSYTNVTITSVSATDIYFIHAGGTANVKLKSLSPELQKHFNYDPKKAQAAEAKLAENKAQYHQQLLHQTAAPAPGASREAADLPASEPFWKHNLVALVKQARAENKMLLLDFTGSDWCGWCMKFDQDVLGTDKFGAYAVTRLKLVKVDFPKQTPQDAELKKANAALADFYHVNAFPTFVLVSGDGRELGRQTGYLAGGPDAFIAELEKFRAR